MCVCVRACVCACVRVCVHAYVCACVHAYVRACDNPHFEHKHTPLETYSDNVCRLCMYLYTCCLYDNVVQGEVTVTRDLSQLQEPQYNFTITVTDLDGVTAGPKDLLIYINNLKRPPYINNLPQTVTVDETVTNAQLLIVVSITHIIINHTNLWSNKVLSACVSNRGIG